MSNNLAVTMPKSMSWEADDDEFMDSVREDSKKFVQASPTWTKPEPKVEKRTAGSNLSWSMPNPLGSQPTRFESLAPTRKSNSLGSWRR